MGFHEPEVVGGGGRRMSSFARLGPQVVTGKSVENEGNLNEIHSPIEKLICLMQDQPLDLEAHPWAFEHGKC